MPIYEYQCSSCGQKKEVLQKLSDAPLKDCPACGKPTLSKLISAAGFQLKGSGWYVTDFRGGKAGGKAEADKGAGKDSAATKAADAAPAADAKPKEESKPAATTGSGSGATGQ